MTYLITLPFVYPPYVDLCLAGMADDLKANLLLIDNTEHNSGLVAAWNTGARRVLDEGLDWLVLLSAATRFGPTGGRDFAALLDVLDPDETWVLESSAPVNQHLFAVSRRMLEGVGLFDENWLIYGADADFSRRVHIAQSEGWGGLWANKPVDAWIAMAGHATKLAGVEVDYEQVWGYYVAKHGGLSGHEMFSRPFNDPDLPLSFWPTPPDPRSVIPPGGW